MSPLDRPIKRKRSQSPETKSLFDVPAWNSTISQSDVPAMNNPDVTATINTDVTATTNHVVGQSSAPTPPVAQVTTVAAVYHTPGSTMNAPHNPMTAAERINQHLNRPDTTPDIFTVFVGSPEKRFDLRKSSLCEASVFFKNLTNSNTNIKWHRLPSDSIAAWDVLALWLENHEILDPPAENPAELPLQLLPLAHLYNLATERQVGGILSSVIIATYRRLALESTLITNVATAVRFLVNRRKFAPPISDVYVGWLARAVAWTDENLDIIWNMPVPIPKMVFRSIGDRNLQQRQEWARQGIEHYSTAVYHF